MILNLKNPLNKYQNFAMKNEHKTVNVVMKTALAFGGINSAIIYKAYS